jgi:hypothetical protein
MRCTGCKTGAKGSYKPVQIPCFPPVAGRCGEADGGGGVGNGDDRPRWRSEREGRGGRHRGGAEKISRRCREDLAATAAHETGAAAATAEEPYGLGSDTKLEKCFRVSWGNASPRLFYLYMVGLHVQYNISYIR